MGINVNYYSRTLIHYVATSRREICMPTWPKILSILIDTSNFETTHLLYSLQNHRVLGKFKSETGSLAPTEFVCLRAKMYRLHVPNSQTKLRAKSLKNPTSENMSVINNF